MDGCTPLSKKGMKERDEFSSIIGELFSLIKKDGIVTLALYPLNKKMGSFPLSLMARLMIYFLDMWVMKNEDDKTFKLSSINIVCENHPQARAFCTELLYMDEEIQIGGYHMKGKRRLSEEMVEDIDQATINLSMVSTDSEAFEAANKMKEEDDLSMGSLSPYSPSKLTMGTPSPVKIQKEFKEEKEPLKPVVVEPDVSSPSRDSSAGPRRGPLPKFDRNAPRQRPVLDFATDSESGSSDSDKPKKRKRR